MYVFGAGGHAKVIIEILEGQGVKISGLFDDNIAITEILGYKVTLFKPSQHLDNKCIVAIGNNLTRQKVVMSIIMAEFGKAIHAHANISARSVIGEGTVVMGGVTINVDAMIGKHCIVNTNASIDHDCVLEDFVHISPNVALCGNVTIGEGTHIGAGATVIPGKKIGKWCKIGGGAVIITDVPDFSTVVGNPGMVIKTSR